MIHGSLDKLRASFQKREDFEAMRRRILHETEEFLEEHLVGGKPSVRIPAHPVGRGRFPRWYAAAFWRRVLVG